MAYDERDRDWSDAVASQGMPMIDGNHQKLEGGKQGCYPRSQREHGPANILILDFWTPEA